MPAATLYAASASPDCSVPFASVTPPSSSISSATASVDSSWAFLNHPPHFSATSFYSFRLQDIIGFKSQADPAGEQ